MSDCPCSSGMDLAECCAPVIEGRTRARTAEQLMRARYTAHTQARMDFVTGTHDPQTRDRIDLDATLAWARDSEWLGLEIRSVEAGGPEDQTGVVEFVAHFREDGERKLHHEAARFARDSAGEWIYVDGDAPDRRPVQRPPRVGRNEPCPCGSGRKYKKCCAGRA